MADYVVGCPGPERSRPLRTVGVNWAALVGGWWVIVGCGLWNTVAIDG